MSYPAVSIATLAKYWVSQGGVNLGIVGDSAHQVRASYHNGKDAITKYGRTSANDYSIRTARDKAGLTNAASGLDLGRLDGSLTKLWSFSRWFAQQCMDKKPGYSQVREVIFWSPVREKVLGWSALDPTRWIEGYGDLSHKTHTHISFYRDTEATNKVPLFSAWSEFTPVPAPTPIPPEEDMLLSQNLPGFTATVKKTANVRSGPKLGAPILRAVVEAESWVLTGAVKGDVDPDGGSDQWYVRWGNGRWEYTALSNLIAPPLKPASVVDLEAARAAAKAAESAAASLSIKIANAKASLA